MTFTTLIFHAGYIRCWWVQFLIRNMCTCKVGKVYILLQVDAVIYIKLPLSVRYLGTKTGGIFMRQCSKHYKNMLLKYKNMPLNDMHVHT
jgi:hypothetical protein